MIFDDRTVRIGRRYFWDRETKELHVTNASDEPPYRVFVDCAETELEAERVVWNDRLPSGD